MEDAEDIVQQVMIAIANHIGDFRYDRDHGRFRSWIQTIAANKVRDRLRGVQRDAEHGKLPFDEARDGAVADDHATWTEEWMLQDTLWCLEQVRSEFAPHRYEAFRLYAIEGEPASAVAEKLGMTPGHVYVTRSQIARRVRELMKELNEKTAKGPGS